MTLLDISDRPRGLKRAVAAARLTIGQPVSAEKMAVARMAASQAAKEASRIIPSHHPAALEFVGVDITQADGHVDIHVEVKSIQRASVETEALLGATGAAIALHEVMGGGLDIVIDAVILLDTSESKKETPRSVRAGVLVLSDSVAGGNTQDRSGTAIRERLIENGVSVLKYLSIPDDSEAIERTLRDWCQQEQLNLIITTGGTGLGPRDNTPEAMDRLIERRLPGVEEAIRAHGQERTPFAMLARSRAGMHGSTLLVALPGSPRAVGECMQVLLPTILHAVPMAAS